MRALVIHRRTTWSEMTESQDEPGIVDAASRQDPIVERILLAHNTHTEAMDKIREVLTKRNVNAIWRHDFSGVLPDDFDLVITLGGDGTVLHVSHFIGNVPVLAINSSPQTSTGYFSAGDADDFSELLDRIQRGTMPCHRLQRMEVMLNGEVVNSRVLNDVLFSNVCPASTTRYVLRFQENEEEQVSSGIWVSTAAGSTAALRAAGGWGMDIDSASLQFVVREPCPSGGRLNLSHPECIQGEILAEDPFSIRSRSAHARLYIDGPHVEVPVKFGDIITFSGGVAPLSLFGDLTKNKT